MAGTDDPGGGGGAGYSGTDGPGDHLFRYGWSRMIGGWGEGGPSVSRGDCLWQAQMVRGDRLFWHQWSRGTIYSRYGWSGGTDYGGGGGGGGPW